MSINPQKQDMEGQPTKRKWVASVKDLFKKPGNLTSSSSQSSLEGPSATAINAPKGTDVSSVYRIPVPNMPVMTSKLQDSPPTVPTNTSPYSGSPPVTGLSDHSPAQGQTQSQPEVQPHRIIFDDKSGNPFFLVHSPWPVMYEDEEYPSTAHLLEALKFLPKYPGIAQRIRLTKAHRDIQRISAENAALVDPAFTADIVENVYKVVKLKFEQHADLRYYMSYQVDSDTQFIYNDPSDSFWGVGVDGKGMNELGKVLQRINKELKYRLPPDLNRTKKGGLFSV